MFVGIVMLLFLLTKCTDNEKSSMGIMQGKVTIYETKLTEEELKEFKKWQEEFDIDYNTYREQKEAGITYEEMKKMYTFESTDEVPAWRLEE